MNPIPTIADVPENALQIAVNTGASIKQGFFDIVSGVWLYVILLIVGLLAIHFVAEALLKAYYGDKGYEQGDTGTMGHYSGDRHPTNDGIPWHI